MKHPAHILAISIAALLAGVTSQAATLFYDGTNANVAGNGNGASAGTAGTWNTTILNWDIGAVAHVAWSNSFADTATFGGTGAAVTVGGTVRVGTLNIASNSYTFNTGTIDFGSGGAGLAPEQAVVIPIAAEQADAARALVCSLRDGDGLRVSLDARGESLARRIAEAHERGVPFVLVLGRRELENGSVAIRSRAGQEVLARDDARARLVRECARKPMACRVTAPARTSGRRLTASR